MDPKLETRNTELETGFALRAYPAFVAAKIACYVAFALLPFVLTGAWRFSYAEISAQVGVPGYPLGAFGVLLATLSGLYIPALSFLPLLFTASLLARGEVAPALRPVVVVHILYVAFVFTYGLRILTWMFD